MARGIHAFDRRERVPCGQCLGPREVEHREARNTTLLREGARSREQIAVQVEECDALSELEVHSRDLLKERRLAGAGSTEHQRVLPKIVRREPADDLRPVRACIGRERQTESVPPELFVQEAVAREVEVAEAAQRARARRLVAEREPHR